MKRPDEARQIFGETLEWFKENYGDYEFFAERDLVWIFQQKLKEIVTRDSLALRVYNDFPMLKAIRRSRCTDLAILNEAQEVELAIEFKYELDH